MKKILCLIIMAMFCAPAFAIKDVDDLQFTYLDKVKVDQHLISRVGFRLLNANKIDKRIVFYYSNDKTVNAFSNSINRQVTVYRGIVKYMDHEDELAAIMAHEISHSIDAYNGIFRGTFSSVPYMFTPRKFERKSDLRGVDFMVNAGYNPLAMIVIMNKTAPQYSYEALSSHPLMSRRLAYIYEYIYTKYPAFLVNNEYIDNIYYQNFLLNSESNRKKLEEKVKSGSNKKVRYD